MKKSFMTRALATGLSLAMALSLSVADTSIASAAAKKASVTSMMKVSSKSVTEGKKVTTYMNSTAAKKYRIKSHTESATAKKYISVVMTSNRKGLTITAKDGAVTAANLTKKGVNVKINFAPATSVAAVKKAAATKYVNLKVVVNAKAKTVEEKAISSAKQTGVKTITVTTTFDATNSKVALNRGSSAVATDKISFSDDGKTITINTTANIVEAEYKVTVDEFEATVNGETSKVETIEILSDKAAAVKSGSDYKYATVGYKVTNQFGDDITKTTSLTANSSAAGGVTLSSKDHMITFYSGTGVFMINRDVITVTLLDTKTGKSASANLTVSMEAYAKEMTFEGIYNSEGKTLTEDTDTSADTFYLLFSAVDQYGNKFKSYKNVVEGDDLFLSVMGGMTTLEKKYTGKASFVVVTKDGTDYLAYPVSFKNTGMAPTNGEATIQLLSTGGTSCTGTVTVAEGTRVTAITVTSPGVIPAGEKTTLNYVATDASGKEVTAYKILRHVDISTNATFPVTWVKNTDGTAKLVLDASDDLLTKNQTSMQTYTFTTQGKKFYHSQLTITENARPVAIDGVKDVDTTISSKTKYISIKLKNLKIEDQYGRIMSNDALKNAATKGTGIYQLSAVNVTPIYNTGVVKVDNFFGGFDAKTTADTEICQIKPLKKGDGTVEFQIHNGYADSSADGLNDASADVLFTVKDTSEVETATATVDNIYVAYDAAELTHAADYAQTVTVKAGGATLSSADYHVSVPSDMTFVEDTSGATSVYKVYANVKQDGITEFKNNTASTVTRKIKITLNGTGDSFTTDVTLCKEAPYVKTVSLASDTYAVGATGDLDNLNVFDKCFGELKDQYGKKLNISDVNGIKYANGKSCTPNVTFSYKTDAIGATTITNNGKTDAKLTVGADFDACTMTVAFNGNIDDKTVAEINLINKIGDTSAKTPLEQFNTIATDPTVTGSAIVSIIDGSKQLQNGTCWSKLNDIDKLKAAKGIDATVGATTYSAITAVPAVIEGVATKAAIARVALVSDSAIITGVTTGTVTKSAIDTTSVASTVTLAPTAVTGGGIIAQSTDDIVLDDTKLTKSGTEASFTVTYVYSDAYLNTTITYKVVGTIAADGTKSFAITKVNESI